MNEPNSNGRTVTRNDIAATRYQQMRQRIIELRREAEHERFNANFYRALSFGLAVTLVIAAIYL